jgi:hypothetical protein
MKPFMNKGWEHYEKMQAILFSTAARGSHIYRPAQAPLAIVCDDDEPTDPSKASIASTSMAAAIATASNFAVAATETLPLMDVDDSDNSRVPATRPLVPPPFFLPSGSGSAGKRTHSVMSLGSEDVQSVSTEITAPSANTDPVLKKQAKNSDRKSHSSRHESQVYSRALASGKVTQASAMVGMQSQISRLTDVFEKSMSTPDDGTAAKRSLAISQMQEFEDGLTVQQKVKMISKFQKDVTIAQTYLDLLNGEVRQAWLLAELED